MSDSDEPYPEDTHRGRKIRYRAAVGILREQTTEDMPRAWISQFDLLGKLCLAGSSQSAARRAIEAAVENDTIIRYPGPDGLRQRLVLPDRRRIQRVTTEEATREHPRKDVIGDLYTALERAAADAADSAE